MRIFLSYASEWKPQAEAIAYALRSRGHQVFFDRDDLPDGESYDDKIQRAIARSDMLIFLVTPDSVEKGRYTLTELRFARAKWPAPSGRVLPVMLAETPMDAVPGYLKAVTILEPQGAAPPEIAFAVDRLRGPERALRIGLLVALAGVPLAALAGLMPVAYGASWLGFEIKPPGASRELALDVGALAALWLILIHWRLGSISWRGTFSVAALTLVAWMATASFGTAGDESISPLFADAGDGVNAYITLMKALTEAQKTALATELAALREAVINRAALTDELAQTLWMMLVASTLSVGVIAAFTFADRAFRSATRWAVFVLLSMVAGALAIPLGEFLGDAIPEIWIFEQTDIRFAGLYLPWLLLCPSAIAFWLVRGQDR